MNWRSFCVWPILATTLLSVVPAQDPTLLQLEKWLETKPAEIRLLEREEFAKMPLDRQQSQLAIQMLWKYYADQLRPAMLKRLEEKAIHQGELQMRWLEKRFGTAPPSGHALFISMHGGGGAPTSVNDRQWSNQIKLYEPEEGIVVAPRAPTDTWNLWHQSHIDGMFDELILTYQIAAGVDPSRVYLLGYSAGGDGVYQLAPRMADRFAAACMMAGHPNETQPQGLRNLPFAIFMGGKDAAYKRNEVAQQWSEKLAKLRQADPQGYEHKVTIYPDKGHWMGGNDREGIPWMSRFRRQEFPKRIVWRQDDVVHDSFYWISLSAGHGSAGAEIVVEANMNSITLQGAPTAAVTLWLNDELVDLDEPLTIRIDAQPDAKITATRSVSKIAQSLSLFRDPMRACPASIELPARK